MEVQARHLASPSLRQELSLVEHALRNAGLSTAGSSHEFVRSYCSALNIQYDFRRFESDRIYSLHTMPAMEGSPHRILLNQKVQKLPDGIRKRALRKYLIYHELAHIIMDHLPRYFALDLSNPQAKAIAEPLRRFTSSFGYSHSTEIQSDLLAVALATWPRGGFRREFWRQRASFEALREHFVMPLDCLIKWAIINFAQYPMHYLKYNVQTEEVEDWLIPEHTVDYQDFPWKFSSPSVFKDGQTIAARCLNSGQYVEGISRTPDGKEFHCKAHYITGDNILKKHDKIVVIGFPVDVQQDIDGMAGMM